MKKFLKFLLFTVGLLLAIVVLLVATLPLWLGPVARPSAEALVPTFTKTTFKLGELSLNPYNGRLVVGDMVMGNPGGYREPIALSLSNLVVDVAMGTLGEKYVHIEEVTVKDLFISYVDGGEHGDNNFEQIQYNIAGGKSQYKANKIASDAKKAAEEDAEKSKVEKMSADERKAYEEKKAAEEEAAKKVVIDRLTIDGVKVKYKLVTIPIPVTITLTDLGKAEDGLTLTEAIEKIWQAILKNAMAVGDGAKALGSLVGAGAGKAVDAIGSGAGKAADAIGTGASKAAETIGTGAQKAAEGVKKLLNL